MANAWEELKRETERRKNSRFSFMYEHSIGGYHLLHVLTHPWIVVSSTWRSLRFAWQRVYRGWDDRAVWALDIWVAPKLIEILTAMADSDHAGIPLDPELGKLVGMGYEDLDAAVAKWHEILHSIIAGMEADMTCADPPTSWSAPDLDNHRQIADEGWKLFAKWRNHLWV